MSAQASDFREQGWCGVESAGLARRVEDLIDAILAISHEVYAEPLPDLDGLEEKSAHLSEAIAEFARRDRRLLSVIYDAIKNLPAFHAFYGDDELMATCRELLDSNRLLTMKDSVGIRIDLADEDAQLTNVHQEFHSFPISMTGLVVWCPLTPVNLAAGTLAIWEGTHGELCRFDGDAKAIAALRAEGRFQEAQKQGRLALPKTMGEPIHLDAKAGQVFFMSALTLHESVAATTGSGARLTCQMRVFSIEDPFFRWKIAHHGLNTGLKEPITGQALHDAWKADAGV